MTTTPSPVPSAWQLALGRRLADALARGALAHPPARDDTPAGADADVDASRLHSPWRVARAAAGTASPALQALARDQAADPAGRARAGALMARCLQHYREQVRPDDEADDAGVALACFLAACVQAETAQAVTPARWRAVLDWVLAWADDGGASTAAWHALPAAQQSDVFARMAALAVAVGEWSVVASRQGEAAMRSARLLAASSLRAQLGLELTSLAAVLRALPGPTAAADPDWGEPELPKAPTTPAAAPRL